MATLSTHVLDTSRGCPAAGITVTLYALGDETTACDGRVRDTGADDDAADRDGSESAPQLVTEGVTNADGRMMHPANVALEAGTYELVFEVGTYFARSGSPSFYTTVPIRFAVGEEGHYHVPLLLSPWAYSTYRGS